MCIRDRLGTGHSLSFTVYPTAADSCRAASSSRMRGAIRCGLEAPPAPKAACSAFPFFSSSSLFCALQTHRRNHLLRPNPEPRQKIRVGRGLNPVSYTHLDVYKRQWPSRPSWPSTTSPGESSLLTWKWTTPPANWSTTSLSRATSAKCGVGS